MRVVLQRVSRALVRVEGATVASIGRGVVAFVGVAREDEAATAERLAAKVARLRMFEGATSSFELTLAEVGGEALVVSQFTLLADVAKGTRPSLSAAAAPELAEPLYEAFCDALRAHGVSVSTGVFGARMEVELVNEGPVTLLLS
jgi:D-tyrosyl-tRNA(Tyr) deacylase